MTEILDCLPHGAGTCRNEAMIEDLIEERDELRRVLESIQGDCERAQGSYKESRIAIGLINYRCNEALEPKP